jgi:large subunit ribosomal protein L18e
MMSKTKLKQKMKKKTNANLVNLVTFLRKQSDFWRKVSEYLSKPKRQFIKVNLEKIEKLAKDNSTVVVPGKVLGDGELNKKIMIAAFSFSEKAKQKLKGQAVKIEDLAKENKKGDNIQLII